MTSPSSPAGQPFAPEKTEPRLLVTAAAVSITALATDAAGPAVFPGNPRGMQVAVWLPAGQPHGQGLPGLSVVLGESTSPRSGVNMVLGLHHDQPMYAQLLPALSGRTLRIVVFTQDEVAGFTPAVGSAWTQISLDELRHEVTHEHGGRYSTLLSTSQLAPVITSSRR